MRALVVEDDTGIQRFLVKGLREASFAVDAADDGIVGYELANVEKYDVIILDLMLPGMDGLNILKEIRESGNDTPVICLTARDAVEDRIQGLDFGADDYLAKPFSFAELLARIRALLRRGRTVVNSPIVVADLTVDLLTHSVDRAGRRIDLSAREYALLEYLARHAGEVLSRTMILEHVWDMNQDPLTNVVDVHINRLRKKVDHGFDQPLIHTIRGVGYVLRKDQT
ncbi:MAG: heavy metal response regulator transcription factor [Phycisphaerae bacterium]|nr:heavy metal response regulator transcription factor [Phycisphaerae bacterium]